METHREKESRHVSRPRPIQTDGKMKMDYKIDSKRKRGVDKYRERKREGQQLRHQNREKTIFFFSFASPSHECHRASQVLQAAVKFGLNGGGLFLAFGAAIGMQGAVLQQMFCCLVCGLARA